MTNCANCNKPIVLAWRGKSGVYCSDQCRRQAEESAPVQAQNNVSVPEPERKPKESPTSKPARPKAEAGAAKAEAKSKAKAKPQSKSRVRLPGSVVIRVLKEVTPRGLRGRMHALLRDGMTADEYRQALRAAGIVRTFVGHLRWAEGAGVIRLEGKPEDW